MWEQSQKEKKMKLNMVRRLRAFGIALALVGVSASSTFALGGPPAAVPGESRPDPIWDSGSGIEIDLNENGTPKVGQTGQVTAPQNQTVTPAVPAFVEVATGQVITVSIQAATDYDHWSIPWQAGTGPTAKQYGIDYGDAADSVNYSWSGAGTFTSPANGTTSWTAPATSGDYTLICTLDDSNSPNRNDGSVSRSVVVRVLPPKKWTAGHSVGTNIVNGNPVADGRMTAPQNQTGTPTPAKIVVAPGATLSPAVETAHDWDHWERDLNVNGTIEAGEQGDEENAVTYKWTANGGVLANSTSAAAGWTAPFTPGRYTLTCEIDDVPMEVIAPNTGTQDDAKIIRYVYVDVWEASIKVKRKDKANYDATTTIAGGGIGTPVHQADVELTVTDSDGDAVSGAAVNAATLNGGGFNYSGGATGDVLNFAATGADGKSTASLTSRRIVDDEIAIKVPYDATGNSDNGVEAYITQIWGVGTWTLPEYLEYDTPASISYKMAMDDGVEIGGHGIIFMPVSFEGSKWDETAGEDLDEDGLNDGQWVPEPCSDTDADLTNWNTRKSLAAFVAQPPTGSNGGVYNADVTLSSNAAYRIESVSFVAWDTHVDDVDGIEIEE